MHKPSSFENNLKKMNLFLIIFQIMLSINIIFCGDCKKVENLLNKTCYNDLLIFNDHSWRAGHACTNKKNVTFVEFSRDSGGGQRLLYALKDNGRYYFSDYVKSVELSSCADCTTNNRSRYESRNLFISLSGDSSKTKQYLFSMSSFYSLVELIDIDNPESINYHSWDPIKFFDMSRPIFSLEFSLFEIENTNTFIVAFIESAGSQKNKEGKDEEYSNTGTIIKFQLDNFASSNHRTLLKNPTPLTGIFDGRAISAFRFDTAKRIVLVLALAESKYVANIYDDDLEYKNQISIYNGVQNIWLGAGIFIKGISIKDDYAALAFFSSGNSRNSLVFKLIKYKSDSEFEYKYDYSFSSYSLRQDIYSNGFYKLEDNRIVLFSTSDYNSVEYGALHMFLFDFYNNYTGAKIREYKFYYPDRRFVKEMAAYMYNGYVLFTATLGDSDQNNIFASMMIFGFGNGTDHEIDISPYLMDNGNYWSIYNLFDYLIGKMVIDNNIFGYEKVQKIRLISICDELLLYKGKLGKNKEENTLPLNELFDSNITLLQNKAIEKEEDKLYTLEYQYLVKEPSFDNFYGSAHNVIDDVLNYVNAKSYYSPKTLNGRVNILSFKLCHKYCIKCLEFGLSNDDQRCVNCKEEYTYDYLAYVNRFTGNCVPYNYMYDVENKKLKYCYSYDYKFYHNKTRSNRKYCFKYDYECPDVYHYLETTNNECIDYTPPTTIPEIPTTIPEIPTTIPEKPTTIPEIPTTIPEKPTTIPEIPTTIPEIPTTIPEKPTTIQEIPTTIVTEKQTTIITEIPTTIVTEKQTTIITEKPTTIPEIPTTIPEKQTTIVTEKITTIVTEKPTIIETQKPTTINTEKPTTIITQKQTIINTEKPIHIIDPTNTEKQIDSTIIKDQCASINKLIEARGNVTNQELYEEFYKEILSKYSQDGNSVTCKAKDDHEFQVTTPSQEINDLKNKTPPQPIIDLSGCEVGLKKSNGIDGNNSLILYKYYKDAKLAKEKEVQFEVYEPINYTKLNLTGCKKIILYIPVNLSQSISAYQNIINQVIIQ